MRYIVSMTFAVLLVASNSANAVFCSPQVGDIGDPNHALQSMISALEYGKEGQWVILSMADSKQKNKDISEIFSIFLKSKGHLECANEIMEPFAKSEDQNTKVMADIFITGVTSTIMLEETIRKELVDQLDGKADPLGPGSRALKNAERGAEFKKANEMVMMGVSMLTHILAGAGPNGKAALKISAKERKEAIKLLEPIVKKNKIPETGVRQCAESLLDFLNQKWPTTETPRENSKIPNSTKAGISE